MLRHESTVILQWGLEQRPVITHINTPAEEIKGDN